jgi:hypothetical protein
MTIRRYRAFTVIIPERYMSSITVKTPRVAPTACSTIPS